MKNNSTKAAAAQQQSIKEQENNDLNACNMATSHFLNRFKIVKLLGECGAYKAKGVPVSVIMLYLFNLMFSPMSMFYQIKMGAFHEEFSKNTVYRFLENVHMNWHCFLLRLSMMIIRYLTGLTTDTNNRYALLVDDTPLQKCGKAMELVSKYFNHVTMGYEFGYRILTLAWTDGVTTIPVRYSLLASSYDEKVRGKIRTDLDGRSLGARIRKIARTSMNDLTVKFACDAVRAGIPASVICFDSWFAVPHTISRLMKEANLTVIARLKTNSKQYYEYEGKMMNIKTLYTIHRKRRGKALWKLSLSVNLLVKEGSKVVERIPVKIVYLPNKANYKEWICLLSTDTTMSEEEIMRQYGKRWNIEVMFKTCKQYLRFGKDFQSPSFECQNAQIALAFTRYMFLAVEQRESEDRRSFGELFLLAYQEMQDISYGVAVMLIVSLFKDGMKHMLGIPEEQIQTVVDYVMGNLPVYLLRTLSAVNNVALES